MKYYDNERRIHDTIFGTIVSDVRIAINKFIDTHLKGYKEASELNNVVLEIDDAPEYTIE